MAERDIDHSQPALTATDLANQRTDLALLRSRMAADRTLMAWIRTSLSLISFGFTIYKFLQDLGAFLQKNGGPEIPVRGPRNLGLSLIALGTGSLILASIEHWRLLRAKRCLHHHPHWTDGLLERPVQNGTFLVPSMITELASKK
jgi:putative membrane protein